MFGLFGLLLVGYPAALSGTVAADAGIEYDSNPARVPSDGSLGVDPQGAPLFRGLLAGTLGYFGPKQRLRLSATTTGKVFFTPEAQAQNVFVAQLGYEHGAKLGRTLILGTIDYYDAFQADAPTYLKRDFRSVSAGVRFHSQKPLENGHRIDGGLQLTGQLFDYKPDPLQSFVGPSLQAKLGGRIHAGDPELGHDVDLGLQSRADLRFYGPVRSDVFIAISTSIQWQGPLLIQLGYTAQINLSSSELESYQRHLPMLKVAFHLPGELFVTMKGQLNLQKAAPGLTFPIQSIDEDNRSVALLDLERPLPKGFAISARYTGYFSLPSDGTSPYQRHTGLLNFSYRFAR
ncbi:MAG: hypothetical protein JNM40_23175 [Myxococcales bacterium]|nr:hypothetical protein [Myxococcales bacterium]